jgi:hypothetical protein
LLQAHDLRIRVVLAEAGQVLAAGAAPAVDRLIVVAHHVELAAAAGEQPQPGVLQAVGVLELVHQDVTEALAVMREQPGIVAQQLIGAQQQLGEVDQAVLRAGILVGDIDPHQLAVSRITGVAELRRPQAFLLAGVDEALKLPHRPAILVEFERAQHPLEQAALILAVQDLEVLWQMRLLPVLA